MVKNMVKVKAQYMKSCNHGYFFDINKFSKNLPRTEYEPNLQKFSHLEKVLALTQRIDN